jgi:hypothetical protein
MHKTSIKVNFFHLCSQLSISAYIANASFIQKPGVSCNQLARGLMETQGHQQELPK